MDYKLQYQNTKCSTKFRHLGIGTEHNFLNGTYSSQNPIENAIDKYKDRSSHIATKTYGGADLSFCFAFKRSHRIKL